MQPNLPATPNRKFLLIGAAIAAIVIGVIAIGVIASGSLFKKTTTNTETTSTATPTPTPTPVDPKKAGAQPSYLAFDDFSTYGLSDDQLSALKYGFLKYIKTTKKTVSTVTATKITAAPHNRDSNDPFAINFDATLTGDAVYHAKVEYQGVTATRLYLYNFSTNAVVFDSGPVDLYNGIGNN